MIDNGMPCVLIAAHDLGISGYETPAELEENTNLRARLEQLRLQAGPLMNLGDVREKSVPKMTIVAPPKSGGAISCLLYTSPSPRDLSTSRMPSSA